MEKKTPTQPEPQDPEASHGYQNILKMVILIAVLVGAWILLDWLISGK
jgi:hypothetical protein